MSQSKRLPRTPVRSVPANGSAAKWMPEEFGSYATALCQAFGQEGTLGLAFGDDSVAVHINGNQATAFALDWFPPVVDDLYRFGAISAASAVSRLYATGVKPTVGLNIMALPCKWGVDSVSQVVRGGSDKLAEAGAFVAGGHSIDDAIPKYGLAVFGVGDPANIIDCMRVSAGDVLFYTKPLGLGIATAAYRAGVLTEEGYQPAVELMCALNRGAFEAFAGLQVHGAVYVGERGLAGHLHDLLGLSHTSATLHWDSIRLLEGVEEYCRQEHVSDRTKNNVRWADEFVEFADQHDAQVRKTLLGDAQTGGGLLVAVSPEDADAFEAACEQRGQCGVSRIGNVNSASSARIVVR